MVQDFIFYLIGRYSLIFCFWGECQLGCSLQCICPRVRHFYSFFLNKYSFCRVLLRGVGVLPGYLHYLGRRSCGTGSLGGTQYSMYGLFVIFYFSGGHQSGCSLQYVMVLIIFNLFLFWCLFLHILFYWAVVSSAPGATVPPVTII